MVLFYSLYPLQTYHLKDYGCPIHFISPFIIAHHDGISLGFVFSTIYVFNTSTKFKPNIVRFKASAFCKK